MPALRFFTPQRFSTELSISRIFAMTIETRSRRKFPIIPLCALEGMGVAVLPDFLIAGDIKEKRVIDLYPKEGMHFDLKFTKRRTAVLSKNAKEFLAMCI